MIETKLDTSASTRRIMEILEKLDSGTLIPRPEFQRRLVWDQKDKNEFLRTVLKSYPFPEIYLAVISADFNTAKSTEALVDGQQRITTIHQYFKGSQALILEKDISTYQNLSQEEKKDFLNYQVAVRNLGIADIDTVRDVFKRINRTSHGLNKMERQNAEFQGELKKLGERIANCYFFEKYNVFSDREVRRMSDTVFALSILITMMSTYFHRESEVKSYLEKYNDELPEAKDLKNRFAKVISILRVIRLPKELRIWKKADLFVLIIELDRILNQEKKYFKIDLLRNLLIEFYNDVDKEMKNSSGNQNLQKYFKTTLQATADRSNRIGRGEVIRAVLLKAI